LELKVLPGILSWGRRKPAPLDVCALHHQYADFVFLTLQRLGIRDADLEDLCQEVFVVVHRRLSSYDGSCKVSTWLFGICSKVASTHRRRAHVRREDLVEDFQEGPNVASGMSPEEAAAHAQARRQLEDILDTIDDEKRAIFVMFEVEDLSCEEIARTLGIPLGTVHSRLYAARKSFEAAVSRWGKRSSAPPSRRLLQAPRGMS
jgi:RNA polymerase sigma-70 factor (ECF subfamily)